MKMRAGHTYRVRLTGRCQDTCVVSAALYPPDIKDFDGRPVKRMGCDEVGLRDDHPRSRRGRALQRPRQRRPGLAHAAALPPRGCRGRPRRHRARALPRQPRHGRRPPRRLAHRRRRPRPLLRRPALGPRDQPRHGRGPCLRPARPQRARSPGSVLVRRERRARAHAGDRARALLRRRARARSQRGAYKWQRVSRLLTRTTVGIARRSTLGRSTKSGVRVRPAVKGPVTVTIERFDPLAGWLFARQEHAVATKGRASIGFVAATVGRWRVSATFDGTIGSGSSASGFDEMLVVSPPSG